ncbi:MAG: hypothetical protein OIF50_12410 [Flavobacteriaceae bacterium]|nr:hypothetical protein [Flavobacteriaceae bacterium]
MKRKLLLLSMLGLFWTGFVLAQGSPDYKGGLKVKFDEEGNKYMRFISWAQMQATYKDDVSDDVAKTDFLLRRARVLMFAQINKKFMILTHFGLNSLGADNADPVGKSDGAQLFFHDVWAQYSIGENHAIGGGLHYFNGISRLNNQSTLNIMTLDNNRQSWSTLGLTDQFARHIGVFAKGKFGKLQYRVAINDALTNGLDGRDVTDVTKVGQDVAVYAGREYLGSRDSGKNYAGYFEYNLWDEESNFLPFKVGSYLGGKKVFNIGAGFFLHPNGAVVRNASGELEGQDVAIFAADVFLDMPVGEKGGALTAYATYQSNDYGNDYLYNAYGTGGMFYSHFGYVIPGDKTKMRWQPYMGFASNSYDAVNDNRNVFNIGVNGYMSGHNAKFTLEYKNQDYITNSGVLTLQAMIYL